VEAEKKDKRIMKWVAFISFLGLIVFAVIWNTVRGNVGNAYWGLIAGLGSLLIVIIGISKKKEEEKK